MNKKPAPSREDAKEGRVADIARREAHAGPLERAGTPDLLYSEFGVDSEFLIDVARDWRLAWTTAAEQGVLNTLMPQSLGGKGESAGTFVRMLQVLGQNCQDNGFTMGLGSHVWTVQQPLVAFGTADQKARYLPDMMSGRTIGAFAITEESSGSDALSMKTQATKHDGGYILNGQKCYIGMAPVCDIAIVFASTAPEKKAWGISAFLVERADPGVSANDEQDKIGLKTLPIGRFAMKDTWIPENRRLGPEGAGAKMFQAVLEWERAFILAPHVGAMARQLDDCLDHARTRQSFGKPIIEHQSVANRLADMAVRLETSRLMLSHAAQTYDAGQPLSQLAAMCNLHISEAFLQSSLDAMRTMGAQGYLGGAQTGADVNDALGGVIYSGTSDVQRHTIAKLAGRLRGQ